MPAEPYTASVHIAATPAQVFDYFTNPEALIKWMGRRAVLDPAPGGEFTLDIYRVNVRGRYLQVDPPNRLLISWGHQGSDVLPPGASTLEVTFTGHEGGTLVRIVHSGLPPAEAARHATGWQHFLQRLASAAADADPGPDPWLAGTAAGP